MIGIDIDITGEKLVDDMLADLEEGLRRKVIISAARKSAAPLKTEMRRRVPESKAPHKTGGKIVHPGNLRKSIGAINSRSRQNPGIWFGPRSGPKFKYDGWYYWFLEHGTSKMPPQPFIEISWKATRAIVRGRFSDDLIEALDRKMQSVVRRHRAGELKRL